MNTLLTIMLMIVVESIGFVHNACAESQAPEQVKREISEVEILPEFADGLQEIERNRYLDIVFSLHKEKRTELVTRIRTGEERGVFASRSPKRPNHLGVTTVRLLRREGNKLYVEGADALDGSPVIDIKCCDTSVFEQDDVHRSVRLDSPRVDIVRNILSGDTEELLLKAAQIHGHICPGLALGILGATEVMQRLYAKQEDPLDYILVVEMQNCPVDGFLFVTGCTPGTHRFETGDPGKGCIYLKNKAGKGWKVRLKESNREYIGQYVSKTLSPAEKGIATLGLDLNELLEIEEIG